MRNYRKDGFEMTPTKDQIRGAQSAYKAIIDQFCDGYNGNDYLMDLVEKHDPVIQSILQSALDAGGDAPKAAYGYCPVCGSPGEMRERRPNGDDMCGNGHRYTSRAALTQPSTTGAGE